jgi:large subunit ribosomal protein L17
MRHAKKAKRLGANPAHRNAILKNLAKELFRHERIKSTELRAKEVRGLVDKVITLAKKGDLHSRRQVLSLIEDEEVVTKVFSEIAGRYADRQGGYTRIYKLGQRQGDNASVVLVELV